MNERQQLIIWCGTRTVKCIDSTSWSSIAHMTMYCIASMLYMDNKAGREGWAWYNQRLCINRGTQIGSNPSSFRCSRLTKDLTWILLVERGWGGGRVGWERGIARKAYGWWVYYNWYNNSLRLDLIRPMKPRGQPWAACSTQIERG